MFLIELLLVFVSTLLLLLVSILTVEILAAYLPKSLFSYFTFEANVTDSNSNTVIIDSFVVLIPAHNEEACIHKTLASVTKNLAENGRVLVVADNCTDQTATIARQFDVGVVERIDPLNRGKGFALDCGMRHLENNPPETVVILDADCTFVGDSLINLVKKSQQLKKPVQSLDLMHAPENPRITQKVAAFAWMVKNKVRPSGLSRLKLPCQLMGTGMAFPYSVLASENLATDCIVEDMQLGLAVAEKKYPPVFYSESIVESEFPSSEQVEQGQRQRWESGHLSMIVKTLPNLFIRGLFKKDLKILAMILDLAIPPLSLLCMLLVGDVLLSAFGLIWAIQYPFYVSLIAMLLFVFSITLAWLRDGKEILQVQDLSAICDYVIKKIPLYFKFSKQGKSGWVKTERK